MCNDHLSRAVDRYLDLSEFRANLADAYSHTGRPSIDPEPMGPMLIIGYCYRIRSERRLCEEVSMNLAYRWSCRLGLEDKVPDQSSFSKNRHGRFRDHDGTFGRSAFLFDAENNRYVCPGGKHLKPPLRGQAKTPFRYRASLKDCQVCELKPTCCPNMGGRKVDRSPQEPARDIAGAIGKTGAYRQSGRERKKVRMLFGHLTRIPKLGRSRLRGPSGAHDEFPLAATAQNLRTMAENLLHPKKNIESVFS